MSSRQKGYTHTRSGDPLPGSRPAVRSPTAPRAFREPSHSVRAICAAATLAIDVHLMVSLRRDSDATQRLSSVRGDKGWTDGARCEGVRIRQDPNNGEILIMTSYACKVTIGPTLPAFLGLSPRHGSNLRRWIGHAA